MMFKTSSAVRDSPLDPETRGLVVRREGAGYVRKQVLWKRVYQCKNCTSVKMLICLVVTMFTQVSDSGRIESSLTQHGAKCG